MDQISSNRFSNKNRYLSNWRTQKSTISLLTSDRCRAACVSNVPKVGALTMGQKKMMNGAEWAAGLSSDFLKQFDMAYVVHTSGACLWRVTGEKRRGAGNRSQGPRGECRGAEGCLLHMARLENTSFAYFS